MRGVESVLITRLGALGDILMTLPAVRLLRRSLPDVRLAWLVEERHAQILESIVDVDVLYRMGSYRWRRRPAAPSTVREVLSLVRALRDEQFRVALDLQGLWKSAVWTRITGAPVRIGLARDRLREPSSAVLLTQHPSAPPIPHATDLYVRTAETAIRALGRQPVEVDDVGLLTVADVDRDWASRELARHDVERFVILHLGASWPTKRWEPEQFGRLAVAMVASGLSVIVPHAPDERGLVARLTAVAPEGVVAIECSVGQLAALTARAVSFVGGDSGPYHLARTLGTPTVGLFGPTDPALNGPRDARDRVVWGKVSCSPCYLRSCPTEVECMASIEVRSVVDAALDQLADAHGNGRQSESTTN